MRSREPYLRPAADTDPSLERKHEGGLSREAGRAIVELRGDTERDKREVAAAAGLLPLVKVQVATFPLEQVSAALEHAERSRRLSYSILTPLA